MPGTHTQTNMRHNALYYRGATHICTAKQDLTITRYILKTARRGQDLYMQHLVNSLGKEARTLLIITSVVQPHCTILVVLYPHKFSRRTHLVLQVDVGTMFQQQLYDVCVTVSTGKNDSSPPVLWGTISSKSVYMYHTMTLLRFHPTVRWLAVLKAEKHGLVEKPLSGAVFECVARRTTSASRLGDSYHILSIPK